MVIIIQIAFGRLTMPAREREKPDDCVHRGAQLAVRDWQHGRQKTRDHLSAHGSSYH
ncbi:hypothetical protein CDEST_05179 [Colletotrichum destructivum]|uniref:Uncharacterized protein n=1 Tax=Colletotrichum destructivum TaxID=34406 RepID=A0AAX4IA28_9PEZI|nr:hypothetical protein CDEST_05179 [Colletotrichum destructivum]